MNLFAFHMYATTNIWLHLYEKMLNYKKKNEMLNLFFTTLGYFFFKRLPKFWLAEVSQSLI